MVAAIMSEDSKSRGKDVRTLLRVGLVLIAVSFLYGCAEGQQKEQQIARQTPQTEETAQTEVTFRTVADIPLTGGATRLDYQSFDSATGRLYIAHLGDDMLTVFDVKEQKVVGDVHDLKRVHGVIAVPELHRIFASATGTNELAVIDDQTLKVVARVPAGEYPDGISYAPKEKKLYVSDLRGKTLTAIDATTNRVVATIALSAPAGNNQYDPTSGHVFAAVHSNAIVEIDPGSDKIVATYPLTGCESSHGLLIDSERRIAFAACEDNATLVMFGLAAKKQVATYKTGNDPDVIAFDPGRKRLFVSAESGVVAVFEERDGRLDLLSKALFAPRAHTVSVDPATHKIYFPLQDINGKPVLRIADLVAK
jgi:YVTN family beta-propeller protein